MSDDAAGWHVTTPHRVARSMRARRSARRRSRTTSEQLESDFFIRDSMTRTRSISTSSMSSTTSKYSRGFMTTTETVALAHHSIVARAQLSDRRTSWFVVACASLECDASSRVFARVVSRQNSPRRRCRSCCGVLAGSAMTEIDGYPESHCSCGFPVDDDAGATAFATSSRMHLN